MSDPRQIHNYDQNSQGFKNRFFLKLAKYPNVLIMYKAVAMIMVWSGVWGLFDELLFPEQPFIRYCILLVAGLFFLYIDDGSIDELADLNPIQHRQAAEQRQQNKGDQ